MDKCWYPFFSEGSRGKADYYFDGLRIDNVRMFVSDEYNEYALEVFEWSTFGSILSLPGFQIVQGLPVVMVRYFFPR